MDNEEKKEKYKRESDVMLVLLGIALALIVQVVYDGLGLLLNKVGQLAIGLFMAIILILVFFAVGRFKKKKDNT